MGPLQRLYRGARTQRAGTASPRPVWSGWLLSVTSDGVRVVETHNVLGHDYAFGWPPGGATAAAYFGLRLRKGHRLPMTVESVGVPDWLAGDPSHVERLDASEAEAWPQADP